MKQPSSYLQLLILGLLLIFVNPLLADSPPKGCQPNATYKCMKTCRENCDKLKETKLSACTKECTFGCECDAGYIFKTSTSQECVKYEACQVKCPANMHFQPCLKSDDATCANPDVKPDNRACEPWCVCNNGYVYRSATDRVCVPNSECPK
ncbi:zonadhesin-like [Lissotriton helveticus]